MSMSDREGFIWQDGKLVPWREATTHVLTHSLHYGMGVFEGVRAYKTEQGTAIFRLKEHTERLFRSAHIFQMQMPYSAEDLNEAQKEVIRVNNLESGYLRPLAFYGSEKMGVSPKGAKVHVIIAAWPWGAYLGEEGMERGIRIKTSSFTRHHVNITMVRAKASAALSAGLLVVLCIGETEAQRDAGETAAVLDRQLAGSWPNGATADNLIVAYEPVWAIGTGRTATLSDIGTSHAAIRDKLRDLGAEGCAILYGGSVKADNAAQIMAVQDVAGVLVGGASLDAAGFWTIYQAGGGA